MNATGFVSRAQPWLVRAGTAVWVVLGMVLLAAAVRPAQGARKPAATPPRNESAVRTYVPDFEFRKGTEIVLVLVGAAFCGAQREPGFPQAVEEAKLRVQEQAKARGAQFRAIAVSLDWKTEEALAFLESFGAFDEIHVGSNWLNDGARRYIWADLPGEPVVPQVLVVEREIETEPAVQVRSERVIKRIAGAAPLITWVRAGAPM
ncbi:MAG TPA: hypothetical protein VF006_12645 [Longimicrobium sp.]